MEDMLGKIVKYDIAAPSGLVLISAGTRLETEHLRLMRQHRIYPHDITLDLDADDNGRRESERLLKSAHLATKELFGQIKTKRKIPLMEIKHELLPAVQQMSMHEDVYQLFEAVRAKDEYTHQHHVGVGVLSTLLGRWLDLDDGELGMLSLAATLHDVGKVRVPEEILNKPGRLTTEEYEEMKRHTIYGYELLRETVGLSPRVALVALQHHERQDGEGYPLRLKGAQTDRFSRIVAVADIFHAMSSKRPYHEALPFHEVVTRMRKGFFGDLDPHIVAVFFNRLIRHMVGKRVRLTDGRVGEVVYINPHEDTSPMVLVDSAFIDLSRDRSIQIQDIGV